MRDKEKPVKPVVESNIEPISEPEMREAERSIVKYVQRKSGYCNCDSKSKAQRRFSQER